MNIALIGNGNMGSIIKSIASSQIVITIENFEYQSIDENLNIDVIIDFSHHNNIKYIVDYALKHKCKVVIATTNLKDSDYTLLKELSNHTAVMIDSNFSFGIYLLKRIISQNINTIKNYDIELNEVHHKYKKDSPSGTMLSIEKILQNNNIKYNVHAIRAGTVRGEHKITLYGDDEYIEIKHVALSRKTYALGALVAAKWLLCKEKGLFSYKDCLL